MGLRFFLFAAIWWIAAQTTLAGRVALILTDGKMDDKSGIAVTLLRRDPEDPSIPYYDRVVLVITGVNNPGKVAAGVMEYYTRAESFQPDLTIDWRIRTSWLHAPTNVMGKPAPHEEWYKDLEPMEISAATAPSLLEAVEDGTVDMFQIAPTEDKTVWEIIDTLPKINIFHLFMGYNSRQGYAKTLKTPEEKLALSKRQVEFHKSLQPRLTARHPESRMIFTQNAPSFGSVAGGSQSVAWVEKYFPEKDVMLALRDPFWASIIRQANNYADDATRLPEIKPRDEAFLTTVVTARTKDSELRHQILAMLQTAIANKDFETEQGRDHYRAKNILVPEFTGPPKPTVELGDGNHIGLVTKFLVEEGKPESKLKLVPGECDVKETNPETPPRVNPAPDKTPAEDGWLLTEGNAVEVRKFIEELFEPKPR